MNRIDERFQLLRKRGEKAFSCLLPLGDPDLETSVDLVKVYVDCGVDIVELGLPTPNPYLDSETIARSMDRSMAQETNLGPYFEIMRRIRRKYPETPLEVMAYFDTVESYGLSAFVEALAEADVDAHLLADAVLQSPEVQRKVYELLLPRVIYPIRFMPYPFRDDLLPDMKANARGFLILQAYAAPDGTREQVAEENRRLIKRIREAGIETPLLLAYGISDAEKAHKAVSLGPDGILVGTAAIQAIHSGSRERLETLLRGLKEATRPTS